MQKRGMAKTGWTLSQLGGRLHGNSEEKQRNSTPNMAVNGHSVTKKRGIKQGYTDKGELEHHTTNTTGKGRNLNYKYGTGRKTSTWDTYHTRNQKGGGKRRNTIPAKNIN